MTWTEIPANRFTDDFLHLTTLLAGEAIILGHPTRSALTFEVAVGVVAIHAGRLVAIEQRTGAGEVEVKDLVTGRRFTVEVGSLRGRDASAAFDPRPNDGECGRPLDDDWSARI